MWFRKRDDAAARYLAAKCGIGVEHSIVGNVLHKNDLEMVRVQVFNVPHTTMSQLFDETELLAKTKDTIS